MRAFVVLLSFVMVVVCAPAQSQTLKKPECTAANIESTDEKIGKMPDGPRKTTALSELAAARKTLEAGQTEDCQDHLLKADVQTK